MAHSPVIAALLMGQSGGGPWWSTLSRLIQVSAPPVLQAAVDGRWENAAVLSVDDSELTLSSALEVMAAAATSDLAVEVLWPGQAFAGARWPSAEWTPALRALGRALAALGEPIREAEGVLGHVLVAMLDGEPASRVERIELGRVNAWLSTGAEVLHQRGDPGRRQSAASVLARRPDLRVSPLPIAVEFAVTSPRPCWVGLNVSREVGTSQVVHEGTLGALLDAVGLPD